MNIYILNPDDLSYIAVVNTYQAYSWHKIWAESGNFTLWAPITAENNESLVEENLVWPDNQTRAGVIESIHKYISDEGLPMLEISGRFSEKAYLSRRIIWGNAFIENVPSVVIKSIVEAHSINCLDPNRKLGSILNSSVVITSSVPTQDQVSYCNSYGNLWEEVEQLSIEHGLDLGFNYASNKLTAEITAGVDRSESVNLSTDLGFLTEAEYLWNSTDFCNAALVAGEGEGAAREIVSILPSATQKNRRELYVDARDLQKTSSSTQSPMTDEEYIAVLTQRGKLKLAECPIYQSYSCSLQLTGEEGYIFGVDYNLGDTVTLTDTDLGVQVQAVVKEHQLDEDRDGRTDTVVFGVSVPTITSLVKRRS